MGHSYPIILHDPSGVLPDLEMKASNGLVPQRLDLGHPAIRGQVELRPDQDGVSDFTEYIGGRTVTASVGVAYEVSSLPSDSDVLDTLRIWMAPRKRYFFQYMDELQGQWRQAYVRPDQLSAPLNLANYEFPMVVAQWFAMDGVFESVDSVQETISASVSTELGRSYDLTFNRTYPASPVIGEREVTNLGTYDSIPRSVQIHGPCTEPKLINITQGKGLYFKNTFSLLAGEWLEIDFRAGTILLNGNPANSRYDQLNFTTSDWWTLSPGVNRIKYNPTTSSDPSRVILNFNHAYI